MAGKDDKNGYKIMDNKPMKFDDAYYLAHIFEDKGYKNNKWNVFFYCAWGLDL